MTEHTPGPWHVDKSLHRLVYDANGVGVGEAWHGVNEREYVEEEANARLFAAAPDLLEALKAIYRVAEPASLPGPVPLSIAEVEAARIALDKAEKGE